MGTVLRIGALRVVMHSRDHWPPHVHVIGPDGEARIALGRLVPQPYVMSCHGLSDKQVATAMAEITHNREQLKQMWRTIHGVG